MKRYCLPTALLLSLALNIGVVITVGMHFFEAESAALSSRPELSVALVDYLKLDEQQLPEWRRKEESFLVDLNAAWLEIRNHRERMIREIFSPEPDLALIERERKVIAALQAEQQRQVISQLMEERKILNNDQREALTHLLLEQNTGRSMEELSKQLHQH